MISDPSELSPKGVELLREIDEERAKYSSADKDKLSLLIDIAVREGIYPERSGINLSAQDMVEGYGAYWVFFQHPHFCPHCNADLRSPSGAPFKREIGIYSRDRDMTMYYQCPDCEERWNRFPVEE